MMRVSKESILTGIADRRIKTVSFDVFDTLLFRPFLEPVELFAFLDREASRLLSAEDEIFFSKYRKNAERKARLQAAANGKEDVTLCEIYGVLKADKLFSEAVVDALMEKELEFEERFCYPRKSALELMQYAISKGKRIVVISDMYLPADFILKLLLKNGIPKPEHIFVSCEIGLTKHSGHLYDYVLGQLGLQPWELVHIGDNLVSDVRTAKKAGIKAFPYYRAVDLLKGEIPSVCRGKAFKYAYYQVRSPLPNARAMCNLGTRCMVAVAANRIYDDPYRAFNKSGDYAGDELLFGSFALGMYSLAHALWLDGLMSEETYDSVLFFSRDGYLPYLGFKRIQTLRGNGHKVHYVRISRKAVFPLIMSNEHRLAAAASHVGYGSHSPESLTKLLASVLTDDSAAELEKRLGGKWSEGFASENELMQHIRLLYDGYLDHDKMEKVIGGFCKYFGPFMHGNVLTYDVGYNLRNETILHSFFPSAKITAAYTHSSDDLPLKRAKQGNIRIRQFYASSPFVSWLPRELFLTESVPSCVGYSENGEAIMGEKCDSSEIISRLQEHAAAYMEEFISLFGEEILWLPAEPVDAALPMEAFLHSTTAKTRAWFFSLEAENAFESGLRRFECQPYWKKLRFKYYLSAHCLNKPKLYFVKFFFLLFNDRKEFKKTIIKKLPFIS